MKLRIKENSLRFRLSRSDIATFQREGVLTNRTYFPCRALFAYELRSDPEISAPTARFDGVTITILLPRAQAEAWATSDQVSIAATVDIEHSEDLDLLVEKDFECLHRDDAEEDKGDLYPNPDRGSAG